MFSDEPNVSSLSESDLIVAIAEWLGPVNPPSPEGIGDDCAAHHPPASHQQIVTTDALVYGQHFDHSISARQAGAKLINRNLSDVAAMGGRPERAVLNLLLGPDLEIGWLEDFFAGIFDAADAVDLKIVGGDVCGSKPGTFISVLTLLGSAKGPLTRHTAQFGDALFVTGELGGSLLGRHATFSPRLVEGQWLAETGHCTALIDLTDGLAKDLPSLLTKGQSARLNLDSIPVSADARMTAERSGLSALEHACCDGEDYELLFTVRADTLVPDFIASWQQFFPNIRLSHLGQIVPQGNRARIINAADGSDLPFMQGFEHFRGS